MRHCAFVVDAWMALALALTPAHACGAGRGRVPRAEQPPRAARGPQAQRNFLLAAGAAATVSKGETAPNFEGAHFPQKQN